MIYTESFLSVLRGKTLTNADFTLNSVRFSTSDGEVYKMLYNRPRGWEVQLHTIDGNLNNLIGAEITCTNTDIKVYSNTDRSTDIWTTYFIETSKGSVKIKWSGHSYGLRKPEPKFVKEEAAPASNNYTIHVTYIVLFLTSVATWWALK